MAGKRKIYSIPPLNQTPLRAVQANLSISAQQGVTGRAFTVSQLQVGIPGVLIPVSGAAMQGQLVTGDKIYAGTLSQVTQTATGLYAGTGAPSNALGSNNDLFIRGDGTAAGFTVLYHKEAGVWTTVTFSQATTFPLLAPDGTAFAPSYSFSSHTGFGLYVAAAAGGLPISPAIASAGTSVRFNGDGVYAGNATGSIALRVQSQGGYITSNAGTNIQVNDNAGINLIEFNSTIVAHVKVNLEDVAKIAILYPGTDNGAFQTNSAIRAGSASPVNANGSNGDFYFKSDGTLWNKLAGAWTNILGPGGAGTVTSVGLSAPAEFTVSGSPVTTSGTLTFTKANQSANLVYAGPSSGAAAAPTFRALVAADIPAVTPAYPLLAPDGSAAAPSCSWLNNSNDGWYRAGAHDVRYANTGVDLLKLTSGAMKLTGNFSPGTTDTYSIGTGSGDRWQDLWINGKVILQTAAQFIQAGGPAVTIQGGSTGNSSIFLFQNNTPTTLFECRGNGRFIIDSQGESVSAGNPSPPFFAVASNIFTATPTMTMTGNVVSQLFSAFGAPKWSGAFTVTTAATMGIEGAPTATGGATITTPLSFWVQGGASRFDGLLKVQGLGGNAISTLGGALPFDHFADAGSVGSGETDLYSDTTAAGTLFTNGDKLIANYSGTFVNSASTKRVKIYFGGTVIFDTGALTISAASDWVINIVIIRESSSVVRCSVAANLTGASTGTFANYQRVTGLTLSNTNILKCTGTAGGVGPADNDIVASLGFVKYLPAG